MRNLGRNVIYVLAEIAALMVMSRGVSFAAEWTAVNTGLTNMEVRSLAVDPVRSTALYAGTNWRQSGLPDRATTHLAIDSKNTSVLYAGTACTRSVCVCSERLLFKSMDGGASWSDSISSPYQACDDIRALLLDPTDANTLYYAAALNLSGFPPLSKSTDGGASWRPLSALVFEAVLAMAINPLAPNNLYAGGYAFPGPKGVLKSADGGMTWSRTGLAQTTVTALAIDPLNPSTLYAAIPRGENGLKSELVLTNSSPPDEKRVGPSFQAIEQETFPGERTGDSSLIASSP